MKRSYSYRLGLRDGWQLARGLADALEPLPDGDVAAQVGWPGGADPDEYREGYRDGVARHDAGKRSPNLKVLP